MPGRSPEIVPLTPDRWADLERLFGAQGACGGCWCMWWRLRRSVFEKQKGPANRRALKALVESGPPPGLLAYLKGEPAGWCAVAPRPDYPVLGRSRILKPVDESPVWSVTCLFVSRGNRGQGMSRHLLGAAADFAARNGARILEGYPVDPRSGRMADVFVWTGIASTFRKAGFSEVARRSETRPIMRLNLSKRVARRSSPAPDPRPPTPGPHFRTSNSRRRARPRAR